MTTKGRDGQEVSLSTERKLDPSWATKVYDTLGNFLHVPTVRDVRKGRGLTYEEKRQRCTEYADRLQAILGSPIHSIYLPVLFQMECECGFQITRRVEFKRPGDLITCGQCGSQHYFDSIVDGKVRLKPRRVNWTCGCGTQNILPVHRAKVGVEVRCTNCEFSGRVVQAFKILPISEGESS